MDTAVGENLPFQMTLLEMIYRHDVAIVRACGIAK